MSNSPNNPIYILSAVRTPIGAFQGALKDLPAPKLGAVAIKEAVAKAGVASEKIDECLMGNVLSAGIGQAPARQAALFAGLPQSVRCTTVNRVCGSGLKTVCFASQMIQTGDAELVVAGGMESMSQTPYMIEKGREGLRLGNGKIIDLLIHDGLWDPYHNKHMGECGELCAKEEKFSREEQDQYATRSYQLAKKAIEKGWFKGEIAAVEIVDKKGKIVVDTDEEPARGNTDKFKDLRPAFQKEGTITAANASSLSDGASALIISSAQAATGLKPIARIVAQAHHAQAPEWFTTAPVEAVQKLLKKANLKIHDIDLFEVNEAFSVVALVCMKQLQIPLEKLNTRGGAVALGHPIGASGARILTTLIHSLIQDKKRYGVAAICIGGGEGTAVLVENLLT